MHPNLRQLLIQRSARLQARPALTAPEWGTLSWGAFRNRVEGVAMGLMALEPPPSTAFSETGTAWDWALEVAAACSGIGFDAEAKRAEASILGGPAFNDDRGRQAYHDREEHLDANTPFDPRHTQGDLMLRLQRWNRTLGWDHDQVLHLPLSALPTAAGRAALWNLLYAGGHAVLVETLPAKRSRLGRFFSGKADTPAWDPSPFESFWD